MTSQRERILDHVRANPGAHFSALTRELDIAPGQAQYHLKKLQKKERVCEEQLYGRTHYFLPRYDTGERRALAVLRRETARDAVIYLLENGPSKPNTVADDLGIARSTLEWHLDHLTAEKLVEKQRNDRNHVTLTLPQDDEVLHLLNTITPSFSEKMLDRFIRLVEGVSNE